MKTAALLAGVLVAAASHLTVSGSVRWLSTSHDFGAFDEDMGKVSCTFRFVNEGQEPVVILNARANCGCTIPSYTKDSVEPGDTAGIEVTYDPAGRPGKFDKKIRVEISGQSERSILAIKGTVIGAMSTLRSRFPVEVGSLKLRNTVVPFGEILKGRVKTAFLDGYNQSADTIYPSVSGLPEFVKADIAPRAVPPGEQVTFTFFYDSSRMKDWGTLTDSAKVTTSAKDAPVQTVQLVAIVNEDFSSLTPEQREKAPKMAVSETMLQFIDDVTRGMEQTITITNHGKSPLEIRKIQCLDPDIEAHASKNRIKPGQSADIKVKYHCLNPDKAEPRAAKLNIITNDPDRPQQPVRIVIQP